MEYRLNKIDTDLRQKINDATKEGKVHSKKDIKIYKDRNQKDKREGAEFAKDLEKYEEKFRNKVSVSAQKVEEVQLEADVYLEKDPRRLIKKGLLIDTRK